MSPAPALKRGETAQRVRKVLTDATRPLTITEIIAATGTEPNNVAALLNKWAAKQAVTRAGTQGRSRTAGYTYTLGPKKLRAMRYDRTPEEMAEILRTRARINQNRRADAAGTPMRSRATTLPVAALKAARPPKPAKVRAPAKASGTSAPPTPPAPETVAAFLKRGGRIEKLPGFQRDHVAAPSGPAFQFSTRLA